MVATFNFRKTFCHAINKLSIFNKGAGTIQWGKTLVFATNGTEVSGYPSAKG